MNRDDSENDYYDRPIERDLHGAEHTGRDHAGWNNTPRDNYKSENYYLRGAYEKAFRDQQQWNARLNEMDIPSSKGNVPIGPLSGSVQPSQGSSLKLLPIVIVCLVLLLLGGVLLLNSIRTKNIEDSRNWENFYNITQDTSAPPIKHPKNTTIPDKYRLIIGKWSTYLREDNRMWYLEFREDETIREGFQTVGTYAIDDNGNLFLSYKGGEQLYQIKSVSSQMLIIWQRVSQTSVREQLFEPPR
jgi:hypothetical protein